MQSWDIDETRNLVLHLYGRGQLERARPALRSVADRFSYAKIHIRSVEAVISGYLSPIRKTQELVEIVFADSDDTWNEFNLFLREVGAHATASIQSLHAVGDLLSHAVYYSLAIDATEPIEERNISVGTVAGRLKRRTDTQALCKLLSSFGAKGDFEHIAALSNRAKHRSLVLPALSEDHTGQRVERLSIRIEAFAHGGNNYPAVQAPGFLIAQFEAVGQRINETGNELNAMLRHVAA